MKREHLDKAIKLNIDLQVLLQHSKNAEQVGNFRIMLDSVSPALSEVARSIIQDTVVNDLKKQAEEINKQLAELGITD